MNKSYFPLARKNDLVVQELPTELLVYDLGKNKALCLNQTASMIWQECEGNQSVSEISRILSQKLKLNFSEDLVWLALDQLKKDNLLAQSEDIITPFDGLSRRAMIRRIGFASIIALPVISSLIAPTAIHAASVCSFPLFCIPGNVSDQSDDGCPCNGNPECVGVCPITNPGIPRYCTGGGTGPACAPGNQLDLSAPCCPCTSNPECVGVCPITPPGVPRVCAG